MKLPENFSATFINRVFYPAEYRSKNLKSINSGRCYDWAYYAYCLWPNVLLWTTDMHAWIQSGDKFYDSETVHGLREHNKMPCNAMWPADERSPTVMSIQAFKSYWNEIGGGSTHHWPELYRNILFKGLTPIRR